MFLIGMPGLSEFWVLAAVISVLLVVPFWRIFSKAGFPGTLSLLMIIPVANLVLIWVIAFARWPALK